MITIDFTYETVTPESAEHGDYSIEAGFILPGMWKFQVEDYDERQQWKIGDLAHYINFARSLGICTCEGADWFYSVDPDQNYQTGEDTTYAMHITGISPYTFDRIAMLLVS